MIYGNMSASVEDVAVDVRIVRYGINDSICLAEGLLKAELSLSLKTALAIAITLVRLSYTLYMIYHLDIDNSLCFIL